MRAINHEWNKSMYVASAVCFVWGTKPDFPTVYIKLIVDQTQKDFWVFYLFFESVFMLSCF